MSVFQAIFLGIVQGLTEFLPVSSSGHLAIFQNLFHIDTGGSVAFDVMLHVGTLVVVFLVYWKDICKLVIEACKMLADLFVNLKMAVTPNNTESPRQYRRIIRTNYRKFVVLVIVSTIPTGLIGYFGRKLIEDASATLLVPGICLLITGVILYLSDRVENCWKIPRDISWGEGVLIGIAQGFATLPGISRSGTTIAACTFCGFERKFAVKYSFILSIPAILGAAVLEIKDLANESMSASMMGSYACGMIFAAIFGYISIRIVGQMVLSRKMRIFAYYCFVAGACAIVGHFVLM
jgi:undecaprenyl-diphosphatase